ncbi:MAG: 16S rRNA (cytosine(967)-C(5))-methyltransferase RsmB, partial [Coriobacteriia bacterium]|nr:16S rRNA (cytosine(967)-C(5))-methyltransferase RsmB [Coriobacteriia bacterium]
KRWSLLAEDVVGLTQLQSSLLEASSRLVRPGGFVVYSTCSVLPAENMGVVRGFLGGSWGSQFEILALGEYLSPSLQRFVTPQGCFQSMPESGGPDGHFAVLLRRR